MADIPAKKPRGPFKVDPITGRRYTKSHFDDLRLIKTMLMLVDVYTTTTELEKWTYEQKYWAYDWAFRSHLRASDNNTVQVPDMPEFLKEYLDTHT